MPTDELAAYGLHEWHMGPIPRGFNNRKVLIIFANSERVHIRRVDRLGYVNKRKSDLLAGNILLWSFLPVPSRKLLLNAQTKEKNRTEYNAFLKETDDTDKSRPKLEPKGLFSDEVYPSKAKLMGKRDKGIKQGEKGAA